MTTLNILKTTNISKIHSYINNLPLRLSSDYNPSQYMFVTQNSSEFTKYVSPIHIAHQLFDKMLQRDRSLSILDPLCRGHRHEIARYPQPIGGLCFALLLPALPRSLEADFSPLLFHRERNTTLLCVVEVYVIKKWKEENKQK